MRAVVASGTIMYWTILPIYIVIMQNKRSYLSRINFSLHTLFQVNFNLLAFFTPSLLRPLACIIKTSVASISCINYF